MEYISAEEFLKQPVEVQEMFVDWWKPSLGDLFAGIIDRQLHIVGIDCTSSDVETRKIIFAKTYENDGDIFPLLTEGQLRKFIEDKTECKISISPSLGGKYYVGYDQYADNEDGDLKRLVYTENVLEGLWKVAIKIASKEK